MKIFLIIFVLLFNIFNSYADQNSPKLDELFIQLYEVKGSKEQSLIVSKIWEEWMKIENPDVKIVMDNISDFFKSKNYQSAVSALTLAIELEPDYAEAYNKRATFYFIMGDYENSMRDIEATLYLEPRHFGALDGLSRILINYKNYDGALKVYQEMKKLMPNDISVDMRIENLNQMLSKET
jgi:tetratricopeptide (TPR) repeat protein